MATPSDGIGYIQNGPSGPYVHLCHALGALIYLFLSHGIDVNPGFGDLYFTFDVGMNTIDCLVSILGAIVSRQLFIDVIGPGIHWRTLLRRPCHL